MATISKKIPLTSEQWFTLSKEENGKSSILMELGFPVTADLVLLEYWELSTTPYHGIESPALVQITYEEDT